MGGTLNIHRAESILERCKSPRSLRSVLQNCGGTEPNRTVNCLGIKAAANNRHKTSRKPRRAFGQRNFEPWSSDMNDT
ncbi:hypothetical protein TNCV_3547891 [Trichonephila clavipes]|nr:hypothetical protein TNCV_3547891 [Trichonephila clavipes]